MGLGCVLGHLGGLLVRLGRVLARLETILGRHKSLEAVLGALRLNMAGRAGSPNRSGPTPVVVSELFEHWKKE